ncbi:MAG: LysR family transcriptional regulator [Dorea sp.]|nr:LysR family transcriptional regulator [Dorea sp.]
MNYLQIDYFLALAKYKSFKKTAECIYVSQPAVSMQISALEKEWGFPLFIRNYKDVELTPAGEIMYNMLSKASVEFESALNTARFTAEDLRKPICIGLPENCKVAGLPEKLAAFQRRYPDVLLSVETCPISSLMYDHKSKSRYDMVMNQEYMLKKREELNIRPLMRGKHMIYISDKHKLCEGGRIPSISELTGERLYIPEISMTESSVEYCRFVCFSQGFTPCGISILPNVNSVLLAVKMGFGAALLDDLICLPDDYHFLKLDTDIYINWVLAWQKDHRNPYLEELADAVADNFRLKSL